MPDDVEIRIHFYRAPSILAPDKIFKVGYWEGPLDPERFMDFFIRMLAQARHGLIVYPVPFRLIENEIDLPEELSSEVLPQ